MQPHERYDIDERAGYGTRSKHLNHRRVALCNQPEKRAWDYGTAVILNASRKENF
jgi:hypothetical protein